MDKRVLSQVPPILLREELIEQIAKVRELRMKLLDIEWVGIYGKQFCPACGVRFSRHEDGCWLKREIDELD